MNYKEYFKLYKEELQKDNNKKDDPNNQYYCASKILSKMFNEIDEIIDTRKVRKASTMIAILNEQNIKANAFIRMVNKEYPSGIKKDLFKTFVQVLMPELLLIGWSKKEK